MDNKRIAWIDNLRGLCMVFVCFHHSGSSPVWFSKFYVPVFLTSFFFVSGYLFYNPSKKFSPLQKLLNIFTSLVIPYFIYCSCCCAIALFTGGIEELADQAFISLYGVKSWFVPALILCQLFCLALFRVIGRPSLVAVSMAVSLALYFCLPGGDYFWNFRNALLAYPFFACGVMVRGRNLIRFALNERIGLCALLLYLAFLALNVRYDLLNGSFNGAFSSYPMFFAANVVGIPAMVYLCSKVTRYNRLLLFVGANSLLYYYLPTLTNIATSQVLSLLHLTISSFPMLIAVVLFKCLLMIVPVLIINRYFPIFAGRYRITLGTK